MTTDPAVTRFPYEDSTLEINQRVEDLLARMTPEDKAGVMFQPLAMFDLDAPGYFGTPSTREILNRRINHFNILGAPTVREIAEWHNMIQREALKTPLGIPITISSDPRHAFTDNPALALQSGPFSQWPEPLGFGAIGSEELVERWAEVVRREYRAVGIRLALHPQIDITTEPRWPRQSGTFGESAELTSRLGVAYIRGLQGVAVGPDSVSAMAKHFPGGGPQKDGEDPHYQAGREQVYPGNQFELHLEPFRAALKAGVSQMMPYYGMPVAEGMEPVGFSFNKAIISDLLRIELGFDGIVCSDWGILSGMFWGVEELTFEERMLKALDAGVDQFGGETRTDVLENLIRTGGVDLAKIDNSVRRIVAEKFKLGLFDERRFVDVEQAEIIIASADSRAEGLAAQAAAVTVLTNQDGAAHLPLARGARVYAEGLDAAALANFAQLVDTPEDADVAIIRTASPWEQLGEPGTLESMFHRGSLEFSAHETARIRAVAAIVPTILDVALERPSILAPFVDDSISLLVNFGASSEAIAKVLFGELPAKGRLPFEIPSSMQAVLDSDSDTPFDTANPTFRFGFGLEL